MVPCRKGCATGLRDGRDLCIKLTDGVSGLPASGGNLGINTGRRDQQIQPSPSPHFCCSVALMLFNRSQPILHGSDRVKCEAIFRRVCSPHQQ